MSKVDTRKFFIALTYASLIEKGYILKQDTDGYIIATNDSVKLMIYTLGRKLSKKMKSDNEKLNNIDLDIFTYETKSVHKEELAISKLKEKANSDYIPCISFGVAKYTYDDAEVCITPLSLCEEQTGKGQIFSFISGNYRYNYEKTDGNGTPTGAILRRIWKAH